MRFLKGQVFQSKRDSKRLITILKRGEGGNYVTSPVCRSSKKTWVLDEGANREISKRYLQRGYSVVLGECKEAATFRGTVTKTKKKKPKAVARKRTAKPVPVEAPEMKEQEHEVLPNI